MRNVESSDSSAIGLGRIRPDSGFALLEVALSLVLLALGASAAMHMQARSLQTLQTTQWQWLAHQHAQSANALSMARQLAPTGSDHTTVTLRMLQEEVQRQLPQGSMQVLSSGVSLRWQSDRMSQPATVTMTHIP